MVSALDPGASDAECTNQNLCVWLSFHIPFPVLLPNQDTLARRIWERSRLTMIFQ